MIVIQRAAFAVAWLAVVATTTSTHAQHSYGSTYGAQNHYTVANTYVLDAESLELGGQYYDATVGGLRDYLDTLETKNHRLYTALDPELSSLESQQTTGLVLIIGGLVGGAAASVVGVTSDPISMPLILTGLGVVGVVPLIGWIVMPGRDDVMDFVNLHNRHSSTPLTWEGHAPSSSSEETDETLEDSTASEPSSSDADFVAPKIVRKTLGSQASGRNRVEIESVGPRQRMELRYSVLSEDRTLQACESLIVVADGTPHSLRARYRARVVETPPTAELHFVQKHVLETLEAEPPDDVVRALSAASTASVQVCGTEVVLGSELRGALPRPAATADQAAPVRLRLPLDRVTLVLQGGGATEFVWLGLMISARHEEAACEIKVLTDGEPVALPEFTHRAGNQGDEYRGQVASQVIEHLGSATRVVGKICDQRFQLSDADLARVRQFLVMLREERELAGVPASTPAPDAKP